MVYIDKSRHFLSETHSRTLQLLDNADYKMFQPQSLCQLQNCVQLCDC